jgi:hypothetical protein
MNWKFASMVLVFACLTSGGDTLNIVARAQTNPVVFTTVPKLVIGHLQFGNEAEFLVRGRASLTVNTANENDTLAGTLVYALPNDARQKIAQFSGKALNDIPSNLSLKNVSASFQRGTACPLVKLDVSLKEADVAGVKLLFDRVSLDIHETPNQINQLFCGWTRQINAKRQRHGIIAAINRLLTVEN